MACLAAAGSRYSDWRPIDKPCPLQTLGWFIRAEFQDILVVLHSRRKREEIVAVMMRYAVDCGLGLDMTEPEVEFCMMTPGKGTRKSMGCPQER